jgi:hypothetical protein
MSAHARLSPSGAVTWMTCPASVRVCRDLPDERSVYAEAGTALHTAAEAWLQTGTAPAGLAGEDLEAVKVCVEYAHALPGGKFIEQRVTLIPDTVWGTADLIVIDGDTLHVVDWKFGQGVRVEAPGNKQLRIYGAAALAEYDFLGPFAAVQLHIVQPFLNHVSTATYSASELSAFAAEVSVAVEATHAPDAPFVVTEAGCRFCRARHTCKARADHYTRIALDEFGPLPGADTLSDDELARLYPQLDGIVRWANDLQAHMLAQAATHGATYPGLKLVEGRSVRRITDDVEAFKRLTEAGYDEEDISDLKLKGIGALEKLVGKKNLPELLDGLLIRPSGKPALVTEDDPRATLNTGEALFPEAL